MRPSTAARRAVLFVVLAVVGVLAWQALSALVTGTGRDAGPVSSDRAWTVTYVYDGDSMEVERDGTTEDVRVIGIDTPERGECGATAARDAAQDRLLGARVELVPGARTDRDTYDRLLRYIEVGGEDYGLQMIADGLAIARYDSRTDQPHDREQRYRELDADVAHMCPEFDGAAG